MHSLGELTLAEAVHQRQHLALYAAAAPAISASSSGRGSGEQPRWPAATGGSQLLGGFLSRVGARESSSLDSVGKKPPPPGSMAALTSTAAAAADSSLFESETIQGEQAWAVWRPQADDARAAPLTLGEALAATRMGPGQPSYAEF
ncbi:hypothetical protein FOA52_016183 [Chlamydomonas sp. UWO 241]|nr:hypothetical protein FOA52_016183 [Chlamydomonas sp. UWO 241]